MTTAIAETSAVAGTIPESRRSGRAVATWISGALYTAVTVVVGLVATPLVIRFLGEDRFGAFRAVSDWMGYAQLTDLGLGTAFSVLLLRTHARPDGIALLLRQALSVLARIALLSVGIGLLLAWYMPALIHGGVLMARELRVSAAVVVISLLATPLLVFRSHLEASQRGYLINIALLLQSLVVSGLSVLLASRGLGLVGQSVATFIGVLVFIVLITWWTRDTWVRRTIAPSAPVGGRELWSLSWPLAVANAGNRLNLMTDTIVVGKFLGATEVAALFLTQRIILLAITQINGLATASWAPLAELRQSGQTERFSARLVELTRLIVGGGMILVGTIAAFDRFFVRLWVGDHLYGGDALCLVTLASGIVFGFLLPFNWAIDMAGDTRHRLFASTTGSALNLVLSIWFVRQFGLPGVALGTLCAYLLTDAWYGPWLVCRRYGVRLTAVIDAAARGLVVGLPWFLGVWTLTRLQSPPDWLGFLGEAAVVGALALAYCWLALLNREDRSVWSQRVKVVFA